MRLTTLQTGVALGLVSIVFFFGALILAYGFRVGEYPGFTFPRILWAGTGALLLSSIAFEMARYSLRHGSAGAYRIRLTIVLTAAVAFALFQGAAAWELVQAGAPIAGNPRASMFYVFLALHGLHVAGGMVWLWHLRRVSVRLETETDYRRARRVLSAAGLYWHFLGVLWLVLFFILKHWSR